MGWDHYPTTRFGDRVDGLAVLPIYGLSAHGLGLGWNIEEIVASTLLARSATQLNAGVKLTVLPPLRMSLAPYQASLTGTDPETFYAVVKELAVGIKATGFQKLVLWSSHPWNTEIIDVISRDIRIELNLQTFVVELGGLGLSLHPRYPAECARVQALGALLTGMKPISEPAGEPTDPHFRPGNWSALPAVEAVVETESPAAMLDAAAQRLARLWSEINARPALQTESARPAENSPPSPFTTEISPPLETHLETDDHLGSFTGAEISRIAREENPLVILPIGAIEQHGPHLPVGVDTFIASAAAAGLKARLGAAVLIAPTMAYGKSNEHADFAGTVGMSATSLRRVLKSRIKNLQQLGFRQFAVLNTHGGNSSVLVYTLREIQTELGVRGGILRLPTSVELSEQESTWGFHAGEWETALMLAIAPGTVQMDQALCHYPATLEDAGELRPENAPAIFSWQTRDIAPDGVMGDATKATTAKGHRWLQEALDTVAEQVRKLIAE